MTGTQATSDIAPEELDRVEELARYLAGHDGRLPTDDLPLAWWLVDVLDLPKDHPVRQALAGIPVTQLRRDVISKKAHAWSIWFLRYDALVWIGRRGQEFDDVLAKDKTLRDWVNDMLSRHHIGTLGVIETLLLGRVPAWDFERFPDTKSSKSQMTFKVGIGAVREFYLKHKHTDLPERYTVAGLDIHHWWFVQRGRYASQGGMKEHLRQQFARLGRLGVDLRTDKERAAADPVFKYRDRLKELADYVGKHGMSALPQRGEPFVNSARVWIAYYHKGTLEPELREALEAIDGWSWDTDADLEPLRAFALTYGHLDMKWDHVTDDGAPVGRDLYRIRKEYWLVPYPAGATKRLKGQIDDLERQGWERGITELKAWRAQSERMPESDFVARSGFHLGAFMRQVYRKADQALLTRAQLKDLSGATGDPGWLESDADAYDRTETVLARFARTNGHCAPGWNSTWGEGDDERDLARFVVRVCADREADDLSPVTALRLEDLPGWSWSRGERAKGRAKAVARAKSAKEKGAAVAKNVREPVRSVRTDVADPDSTLNRAGLRQFLPGD